MESGIRLVEEGADQGPGNSRSGKRAATIKQATRVITQVGQVQHEEPDHAAHTCPHNDLTTERKHKAINTLGTY